jgi:hypothetical protein
MGWPENVALHNGCQATRDAFTHDRDDASPTPARWIAPVIAGWPMPLSTGDADPTLRAARDHPSAITGRST